MLVLGIACAILSIANALAALFYGWHGEWISLIFTANFGLLSVMIQLRVFG